MVVRVVMPKLGMSMREGTIVAWHVAVGEHIHRGQVIADIESEKTVCSFESLDEGLLVQLLLEPGETCAVGEPIAVIEADATGTDVAHSSHVEAGSPSQMASASATERTPETTDPGLNDRTVPGAESTAHDSTMDTVSSIRRSAAVSITAHESVEKAISHQGRAPEELPGDAFVPLTPMRRTIASRLQASAQAIPQVTLLSKADARAILRVRVEHRASTDDAEAAIGVEDVFVHIVARTLVQHRRLNASFEDEGIRYFASAHIGVAVALDEGLVVPVIRDAHVSTLAQIARRRAELIAKARARRLEPADVEGGTFTISNLGKYSVEYFGAIINPPQAGILSIGRIRKEAVVLGDQLVACETVGLGLTFDHRVVDGAVAAQFLSLLVENVENAVVC